MFAAPVLPARGRRERGGASGARRGDRARLRAQGWGQGQGSAGLRCPSLPFSPADPAAEQPQQRPDPLLGASRRSLRPRLVPGEPGLAKAGMCPGSTPGRGQPGGPGRQHGRARTAPGQRSLRARSQPAGPRVSGDTHTCLCTPVPQAVTAKSTNAGLDPRDDQVLLCFYKHRLLRSENGIFLP